MSEERIVLARRVFERFAEGRPAWEQYAEDFQLVNLPDAPWQPSPGHKGLQEWLDFTNEVAEEWGADLVDIEVLDSDRLLTTATWWARFRATGIREEIQIAQVATYDDDDKITRIDSFHTREQALEAAGLSG